MPVRRARCPISSRVDTDPNLTVTNLFLKHPNALSCHTRRGSPIVLETRPIHHSRNKTNQLHRPVHQNTSHRLHTPQRRGYELVQLLLIPPSRWSTSCIDFRYPSDMNRLQHQSPPGIPRISKFY